MNTDKESLIKICEQVATDVENDAKQMDGEPFNGKTVAEYFGYHGAAISALANVLREILKDSDYINEFLKEIKKHLPEALKYLDRK